MNDTGTMTEEGAGEAARGRLVLAIGGSCVALLLAAGGLFWARLGGTVFSDYVLGGLAWCL